MEKFGKVAKWAVPAALMALPLLSLATVTLPAGTELDLSKIQAIIERIANFLIIIGVVIAVIFIVWGGIRYMMAHGDPGKAKTAKDSIIHGIIGAVVVLAVGVILNTLSAIITRSFFGAGQ